jgi:hypothetical protein
VDFTFTLWAALEADTVRGDTVTGHAAALLDTAASAPMLSPRVEDEMEEVGASSVPQAPRTAASSRGRIRSQENMAGLLGGSRLRATDDGLSC